MKADLYKIKAEGDIHYVVADERHESQDLRFLLNGVTMAVFYTCKNWNILKTGDHEELLKVADELEKGTNNA